MRAMGWIAVILGSLFIVGTLAAPNSSSVKSLSRAAIDMSCSKTAVPLPKSSNVSSLGECRQAVRNYVKAMIANVRVTAVCREEFVQRVGPNLPSASTVRHSNRELIKMIPKLEAGAEQQLREKSTHAACKQQLLTAQQLVSVQAEFRGEWAAELQK